MNFESTETPPVAYSQLADLFVEMGVLASPSECHGMLCGQLAQGKALSEAGWLKYVASYLEQTKIEHLEGKRLLVSLYTATVAQLEASGFELKLVIPDEDAELVQRVESVGLWCQGFLAGFGGGQASGLSEEACESLSDFSEIAYIEREELDESEDNEQDLMQVVEYVRMAAILIYSEVMGAKDAQQKLPTNASSTFLH
ncbi:MAG: UPF0149 family protein [Pseudomonadales bacterium]|nr:UPF0149 family protein [Pseudomonadales bacterium]